MKCIVSTANEVKRVSDDVAKTRVDSGKWSYCSKKRWKTEVRDVNKTVEVVKPKTEKVHGLKAKDRK